MLSEIEIKSLQTLNEMIDNFRRSQAEAEKGLKEIDEKYKAIIEKEKKELKQVVATCKKEIDFWEKPIVKRYGKSITELLAKPEETTETEEVNDELPFVEDEKVMDKEAVEESDEQLEGMNDTIQEEKAEEPKDLDAEEDAEWEEKIESGEIVEVTADTDGNLPVATQEESTEATEEIWPDEEKKEVVVENADAQSDKEFEDFPEEW